MYVIFPADDVVSLTYGRVILPRPSDASQLSRVLSHLQAATSADSRCDESFCEQLQNHLRDASRAASTASECGLHVDLNGLSGPSTPNILNAKNNPKAKKSPSKSPKTRRGEKLAIAAATAVLGVAAVQQNRAHSKSPAPALGPDPRLQLTGLHTPNCTTPDKSPTKKKAFFAKTKKITENKMASSGDVILRELSHPNFNEALKSHNSVTFKLVRTVSDFTQQLSQIYEQHAEELQLLVSNFRKRNGELRKERPACPSSLFHTWETLLQEVEIDSQAHSDIASILGRQVSRPLLERSFHRKIQSRKVFTHRESYETIISKTEEKLAKCRQDYKNAYLSYLSVPTTQSLSTYFDTHNAYVQQLHATNGMLDEYSKETLPQLIQELEEIYNDLCATLSEAVLQGAEVISARAMEQFKRYEGLSGQCRSVSGPSDLTHFVRSLPSPPPNRSLMKRLFQPPSPPAPVMDPDSADPDKPIEIHQNHDNIPPPLKNELVVDRLASVQIKPSHDALRKESLDLEVQIKQSQDALDTLVRIQQRSLESSLFNKVNEVQEDISMKRFDLRVAQIHLSAINHQKELFSNKLDSGSDSGRDRKLSNASTGSMKSKWLKAFKSLKTPPTSGSSSPKESEKKNQMYHAVSTIIAMRKNGAAGGRDVSRIDSDAHTFQEYTYKKITPCDVCSQVLRGHTRQGLRCRVCKMNVHMDCQDKVGKCQSKSRLLRRQKSTSEIETKIPDATVEEENEEDSYFGMPTMNRQLSFKGSSHLLSPDLESPEVDLIYQVLKQAGEISNAKPGARILSGGGGGALGTIVVEVMERERAPVGILVTDRSGSESAAGSSGSSGHSLNRRAQLTQQQQRPLPPNASLTVGNPVPHSTSSERRVSPAGGGVVVGGVAGATATDGSMRRRLFAGMKSLTGFGSRSRHGSPHNRSISLPEKRGSTSGQGNRPFGQPLCLNMSQENGNGSGNGLSATSSPDQLRPVTPISPGPPSPSLSSRNNKAANSSKHPPIPNNRAKK